MNIISPEGDDSHNENCCVGLSHTQRPPHSEAERDTVRR